MSSRKIKDDALQKHFKARLQELQKLDCNKMCADCHVKGGTLSEPSLLFPLHHCVVLLQAWLGPRRTSAYSSAFIVLGYTVGLASTWLPCAPQRSTCGQRDKCRWWKRWAMRTPVACMKRLCLAISIDRTKATVPNLNGSLEQSTNGKRISAKRNTRKWWMYLPHSDFTFFFLALNYYFTQYILYHILN